MEYIWLDPHDEYFKVDGNGLVPETGFEFVIVSLYDVIQHS